MSLDAEDVRLDSHGRTLLGGVSLRVAPGRVHALLGPNGAGKTSLLRLLAAERMPDAGRVCLDGRDLAGWPAAALARRRAVMSQGDTLRFGLRVDEVVALGRLPHAPESERLEHRITQEALALADAAALAGRSYLTLSGGERTRVRLARALAQVWEQLEGRHEGTARYLLLDEPAAHLDLGHQHFAMRLLRRFAAAGGGVLVTLHDPNLALAYADDASVLQQGRRVAGGPVREVLTPEVLGPVYGLSALRIESGGVPVLLWSPP